MQPRITPVNTGRKEWNPQELLDRWQHNLQEHDRSVGTVKKYIQAVVRFLAWYEREEQVLLQLSALTPIALIGYRNDLQHEQHKSTSTVRLSECAALTFEDITFGERSGLLRVRTGKGNKARSVPVNASAREAIAAYVVRRLGLEKPSVKAVAKGWPTPKIPEAHEPIFLSQKGGALTS